MPDILTRLCVDYAHACMLNRSGPSSQARLERETRQALPEVRMFSGCVVAAGLSREFDSQYLD